jgi:hypothetical protein
MDQSCIDSTRNSRPHNGSSVWLSKKKVEYLESVQMGEFITGSLEDVKKNVDIAKLDDEYKNTTETLPIPPPLQCNQNECGKCKSCKTISLWQTQFNSTVDDILF